MERRYGMIFAFENQETNRSVIKPNQTFLNETEN